jgi:hypothetical protein
MRYNTLKKMTGQRYFQTEHLPSQRNKDEKHSKHAYLPAATAAGAGCQVNDGGK